MEIHFWKYEGAGNDFVILRDVEPTKEQVRAMCDRHRGVGADGLMVLLSDPDHDFRMIYFNADGSRAAMCGNGARCIALFAHHMGLGLRFAGDDGEHRAEVFEDGTVRVSMADAAVDGLVINTGVPHYVEFTDGEVDVVTRGRELRHKHDANVNFASLAGNVLRVRTYERGVEDETLACGTGAVASAIAAHIRKGLPPPITVHMPGGRLIVDFDENFKNITLTGPARHVFTGAWKNL